MKRVLATILLACISLWLSSCKKFTVGELTQKIETVDFPFQVIEFRDDVNAQLLHADPAHPAGTVIVTAGANLIDDIHAEIDTNYIDINEVYGDTLILKKLIIKNDNTFNYLHTYNYTIGATIYYDTLFQLIFHSNARQINTDTLRGYNYMTPFSQDTVSWDSLAPRLILEVKGGSGSFNVFTNCYRVNTKYIQGTADITIQGNTVIASTFADYDCHGIIDEKDLYSHLHYVNSHGTNRVIAKAFYMLSATNNNIGQIEYVRFKQVTQHLCPPNDTIPIWHLEDTIVKCPQVLIREGLKKENIIPYIDQ